VSFSSSYLPAAFSLSAVGAWGTSDFLGGVGARRVNSFLFTSIVHLSGMTVVGAVALALALPFPSTNGVLWALAAGTVGGAALALFYRALAGGKMGLVAPVSAVLSAAIPTVVTAVREGFPGWRQIAGFVLAGIGVWLISRSESSNAEPGLDGAETSASGESARPEGLGLAVLAGCGFAGFYLCIHQAGNESALWLAVCSRFASFVVTVAIVVLGGFIRTVPLPMAGIAIVAGILDITGSAVFVRASQAGRLDSAVVLSSLYPAVTVLLARVFLHEHFSRTRTLGMVAALAAVPMIAG
jgi:drug/metabolite transporter (DMT)-like permease